MDQDSLINKTTITTGEQLNLPKPVLHTIPETRRDSIPKQRVIKRKIVKNYQPTPEDSLLFNLIVTEDNQVNPLENNLVKDYLYPLKLSNKEWIEGFSKTGKEASVVADYSFTNDGYKDLIHKDSLKNDSVNFTDAQIKDSIKAQNIQDTVSPKKEVVIAKADSLKTTIRAAEPKGNLGKHFIYGTQKDVISGLLLFAVAIVGFLRMANFKYLRELFSSAVFSQEARKMLKAINLRNQMHSYVLNGLFLFNTSIFIYEIILYYNITSIFEHKLWFIPVLMGGILVFDILKIVLYKFIAFVFEKEEQTKEYIYYSQLYSKIFGLIILPVILIIPYIDIEVVPLLIKIGIGMYILLYLMQIFRGLTIILKDLYSLFYMFLYLCALEILPLIILFKIIIN